MRGLLLVLGAVLLAGCPAAPAPDCGAAGTCVPGTPCTTDGQCADGLCDFFDAEGSTARTCLEECGDGTCPAGQVCTIRGTTGYCRFDRSMADAGGGDAGPPFDAGPVDAPPFDGGETDAPAPVDAPAGDCAMEGMMRVVPCPRCGMQSQRCSAALVWEDVGACLGAGECEPATNETMPTSMCGERQRLCGADCTWSDWEQTIPDGECVAGTCRCYAPGTGLENWYCDPTCHRQSWPTCVPPLPPCP